MSILILGAGATVVAAMAIRTIHPAEIALGKIEAEKRLGKTKRSGKERESGDLGYCGLASFRTREG
jgi:hypothetical protein